MKKLFLFLMACCLSLSMSAKVYYLMPTATENAPVDNVYDVLPWEGDGLEPQNEVSPERKAYEWFMDENGYKGDGYITVKDILDGRLSDGTITTLWINIDRANFDLNTGLDALFTNEVHMALKNFVKNGGNLYLSKQAIRLVCQIGRCSWWPGYDSRGYFDGADTWYMVFNFDCEGNADDHSAYRFVENKENFQVDWANRFPLTSGEGSYRRSDNNNGWGYWDQFDAGNGPLNRPGITLNERRSEFESFLNCRILGGWGHTRYIDFAGMVEFFPATIGEEYYAGTVMVMGLAAYQWGPQNKSEYNVKNLTKGILDYLSDEHPFDYVWSTEPNNAEVGVDQTISVEHKENSTVYWWTNKPDVVSFSAETGESVTVSFAKVAEDVVIKALRKGDGIHHRKNAEYPLEKTIFVNPNLRWTHTPDAACVGEEGKSAAATAAQGTVQYRSLDPAVEIDSEGHLTFKAVKADVTIEAYVVIDEKEYKISKTTHSGEPYVYWVAEKTPTTTGIVGVAMDAEAKLQYGPASVQYECTNCSWADDKLTFAAEGTATVRPYVEYYSTKYYGELKTITVAGSTTVYERTVAPGRYGTICLERTSTALEGATFFWPAYKNVADGEVAYIVLEEVTVLKAGYGYFFLPTASTIRVSMSLTEEALPAPVDDGETTHGMHGNFTGTLYVPDFDGGLPNEYILSNNTLVYGTGNKIGEHRAYLKMSEVPSLEQAPAPVPGRKRVNMAVQQPPHTPTDVENMTEADGATKTLINGQVVIRKNGVNYNVLGTKL